MRCKQAMRRPLVLDQPAPGNSRRRWPSRGVDRNGLVIGAVDDQCRYAERPKIRSEIGGRERLGTLERGVQARLHRYVTRPLQHLVADRLRGRADAVELLEKPAPELGAILFDGFGGAIEH